MSALLLKYSATRENQGWLEVLHPDHIHCIHIHIMINNPPPGDMSTSIADYSQADLDSLYQHVTMIVSHPMALQELVITGWNEQDVCLCKHCIPLPLLHIYNGPCQLFEVLLTGMDLHTLTLHGDLWAALHQLRPQSRLIKRMELHVDTFSLTDVTCQKNIFRGYPH
ncbi:hypothetical protein PILCRDRAFT_13726 [Piloderma croceum F 1598]|uniref:Uncharacterized protein n=1 Tax=Piloderma croceum (strain F 1598) TaxID=765440 RepID=A0A0C3F5Z7_PILCF|nr:hypothetical protein PILCRDRAFT_13726 [Piloderma croceum F 1598]